MRQWDLDKYNELTIKHFGSVIHLFHGSDPKNGEAFIKDYLGYDIVLVEIEEEKNISTGFSLIDLWP